MMSHNFEPKLTPLCHTKIGVLATSSYTVPQKYTPLRNSVYGSSCFKRKLINFLSSIVLVFFQKVSRLS